MKISNGLRFLTLFSACLLGFFPTYAQSTSGAACTAMILETNAIQITEPNALLCQARVQLMMASARYLATMFDYDGGLMLVDAALEIAPDSAMLHTLHGELTLLLYEWNNALADFDHALTLDPHYAPAYFERGVLLYTMAEREAALEDFTTYLELAPNGARTKLATQYIIQIEIEIDTLNP